MTPPRRPSSAPGPPRPGPTRPKPGPRPRRRRAPLCMRAAPSGWRPGCLPSPRPDAGSAARSADPGRPELPGEELQRGARLGVLLTAQVDALAVKERPRLGRHLEGLPDAALGRQLDDA